MKKAIFSIGIIFIGLGSTAQTDSSMVKVDSTVVMSDTIRIGMITIITKGGKKDTGNVSVNQIMIGNNKREKRRNAKISTNWGVIDFGFSNYSDRTNYANAGSYLVNKPGSPALDKGDFKLRTGKSVNLNLWFFMQRLSIYKNYLNLKYGLGFELNNYRYKSSVSYREGGYIPYSAGLQTSNAFIFRDSISFSKNKLAADYLTVPFMLNFKTNPHSSNKSISISVGASAGYLYGERNKQKSNERGKQKNKGEYDLEPFKLSYIAELGLGPVRLYGSYSTQSMYEHSMDLRPYTLGFRFSNW
jgi:hypothetical protein